MEKSFLGLKAPTILALILVFALANSAAADADLEASTTGISGTWPEDRTFHPGDSFRIRSIVRNIGDQTSENFTINYYISDYSLGSERYIGLAPQESDLSGQSFTMPVEIPYGEYSIRIEVVCSNDSNPGNDEASDDRSFIYAEKPLSDLEALGVSDTDAPADGIYHPGERIGLDAYVINNSDENSNEITIEYYVGGYSVGSSSFRGLEPGERFDSARMFSLPSDIPNGNYTLRIEVSCPNDGTPGNNESDGSQITIAEKGPPDLYFTNFTASDGLFYAGHSATLICRVENAGHSTSDSYTLDFYMGGNKVGSENRSGIEGHGGEWFNSTITLPYNLPVGVHYIDVELSCPDDLDSGNNSASTHVTVAQSSLPSIFIQSVDATDGIYHPGDSITVGIALESTGGQASGSADIDFYASVDTTISVDDYKIQNVGIGSLQPGESYTSDVTCQFPGNIPLGKYYIGIIATYLRDGELVTDTTYDPDFVYLGVPADLLVQSVDAADGTYAPGDSIIVYSLIKNIGGQISTDYSVNYYLSPDNTITAGDYEIGHVDRAGLAAGAQHSYETTCRLPSNLSTGNYYVGIIVTCSNDSDPQNNVGRDSARIRITQPTDVIGGRLMYQDRDGGEHPIRYALVEICDGINDQVLKETYTDSTGNYSVRVPSDSQAGQDVYVKVYTEGVSGAYPDAMSKICSVRDEVFEEVYCLRSDLYPNPQDSSLTVNMAAPNSGGEFMVFDSIVEGFHKAKLFFGVELKEVEAFWPNAEGYSYYDPCEVEIHISQDDRGDRDVIIHEYGHYFTQTYDFAKGDVGDNAVHYWNADLREHPVYRGDEHARNLAFREAWASLYSIAVQYGDTWYPYSGDAIYQDLDEESEWMLEADLERDNDDDDSPGQYYENMNACALWDIFDDREDGYLDLLSDPGLERIWAVSRYYKPDDILQFWDGWCESFGFERKIKYIFRAHQMPYNDPGFTLPPNRPPVADAGEDQIILQTCEMGAWFTLDGGGSYDPDGDEIEYYQWNAAGVRKRGSAGMTLILPVGQTTANLTVDDRELQGSDSVVITVIPTDPDEWTEFCW